jgi:hypothetical protein
VIVTTLSVNPGTLSWILTCARERSLQTARPDEGRGGIGKIGQRTSMLLNRQQEVVFASRKVSISFSRTSETKNETKKVEQWGDGDFNGRQ